MRRGLSELLAVLLLAVILSSVIALSLNLYSSLIEESRRAASKVSQSIYASLSPPVLSLISDQGSLILEVYTSSPVRAEYALVLYNDSRVVVKQIKEEIEGHKRFLLLDNYRCEKVKVFLVLDGGVVSWVPERDPRFGRALSAWDGWYSCDLRLNPTNSPGSELLNSARISGHVSTRTDPTSSMPVFEAPAPNASLLEVLHPRISLSFTLRLSGSHITYVAPEGTRRAGSGSTEIIAVDLGDGRTLRIVAKVRVVARTEYIATQYAWIDISTSEPGIYKGSIEVVLDRSTFYVRSPYLPWRDVDGETVLVLAYSPGGDQHFNTTCVNTEITSTEYLFTVEGRARGLFETSGPIFIFYNGFAKFLKDFTLRINMTLEEVALYSLKPARVRIEGAEALSARTATLAYRGSNEYDYLTISIDEVMRASAMPRLRLGACYSSDSCPYRDLSNEWIHAWSPIKVFEVEAWPKVGQALRAVNMSVTCYRRLSHASSCLHWSIRGHSSDDLLPSPWSLPHILELRFPGGERALVVFPASSGSLLISASFSQPQRGYAMSVHGAPTQISAPSYWVPALVDWGSLAICVPVGVYERTLESPSKPQSHYIATARAGANLHESLLVWVS